MTAQQRRRPRLIEQTAYLTDELPRAEDREQIEEVEDLLYRALAYDETLREYCPEGLAMLQGTHRRLRNLVAHWDAYWPEPPRVDLEDEAQGYEDE